MSYLIPHNLQNAEPPAGVIRRLLSCHYFLRNVLQTLLAAVYFLVERSFYNIKRYDLPRQVSRSAGEADSKNQSDPKQLR